MVYMYPLFLSHPTGLTLYAGLCRFELFVEGTGFDDGGSTERAQFEGMLIAGDELTSPHG